MTWIEKRPYMWQTETKLKVSVYRDLLGNDTETIWMSIDELGMHRIKLDAKNFKEAKAFAINYVRILLKQLMDEFEEE